MDITPFLEIQPAPRAVERLESFTPDRPLPKVGSTLELSALFRGGTAVTVDDKAFWDAAAWLPPRPELRCAFVARQIAVKQRYALQVSRRERDAMAAVLATCPGQRVPA